jgi:hypothetical protein
VKGRDVRSGLAQTRHTVVSSYQHAAPLPITEGRYQAQYAEFRLSGGLFVRRPTCLRAGERCNPRPCHSASPFAVRRSIRYPCSLPPRVFWSWPRHLDVGTLPALTSASSHQHLAMASPSPLHWPRDSIRHDSARRSSSLGEGRFERHVACWLRGTGGSWPKGTSTRRTRSAAPT